jgi:hypothetical protein
MQVAAMSYSRWIIVVPLALIQDIVCNSKREKDKAIQPLQGKDLTVTNPQIHKFEWLQLVHKVHLGLHSEKKKPWHSIFNWDVHDENSTWKLTFHLQYSPEVAQSHNTQNSILLLDMELWAPIPCNPEIYWHCILMHPQLHCLDTYGPTPFPHGP